MTTRRSFIGRTPNRMLLLDRGMANPFDDVEAIAADNTPTFTIPPMRTGESRVLMVRNGLRSGRTARMLCATHMLMALERDLVRAVEVFPGGERPLVLADPR
jgi:hypothetical protein